ncbi:MAG: GNAT family N-acetyltransferase [Luteolibacter sp.]|jgi:GNAT superfamily N-acetyltransferase
MAHSDSAEATPQPTAGCLVNLRLSDGTPVIARALVPEDRSALASAYRMLSPQARYNRFWTHGGDRIGERMLDRVLKQDPATHITWAVLDPARAFPGVGAASWWRSGADATEAEFSALVLDGDQGRGIGTLLLAILWQLALKEGIRQLVGYALTENRRAANWMRDAGAHGQWDGTQLVFRWDLNAEQPANESRAAHELAARLREFRALGADTTS